MNIFYHLLRDSLRNYSENVHFRGKTNPIEVQLNGINYSVHISDIHFANRQNPEEYRIQITPQELDLHRQKQAQGYRVAFIGAFPSGKVFVGWEPFYVLSMQASQRFSVYCRQWQETNALSGNASTYTSRSSILGRNTTAIALPAEALGFYLENIEAFHSVNSEEVISGIVTQHQEATTTQTDNIQETFEIENSTGERERFTVTRTAYLRDPRFKKHVLAAYNRTCCICNRQLAIVQAAHIIPHSESDSPNTVKNGLALCIEHHRLYDDALLLPGPNRRLVFNEERAEYLRQTKQQRGLDEVAAKHGQEFSVPDLPECHPSDEYLQRGLEIRLGQ
jgi:putative restriction endonuclease